MSDQVSLDTAEAGTDRSGDGPTPLFDSPVDVPVETKREVKVRVDKPLPIAYHLCSWCGGFKQQLVPPKPLKPNKPGKEYSEAVEKWNKLVEETNDTKVVTLRIPSESAKKSDFLVCARCVFRIYNNGLGQPKFYGQEAGHLTGDIPNTGYFPQR